MVGGEVNDLESQPPLFRLNGNRFRVLIAPALDHGAALSRSFLRSHFPISVMASSTSGTRPAPMMNEC